MPFFSPFFALFLYIDMRTELSRGFGSRIDKRWLIFTDPSLCVIQTKKRPFFRKKCLRSCFVNGQFNFVASAKQRPAKRMYLPNSAFNLAFSVPFHANCREKLSQLKYLRTSSLSRGDTVKFKVRAFISNNNKIQYDFLFLIASQSISLSFFLSLSLSLSELLFYIN